MKLEQLGKTDVLVIGAGLAGVSAAIAAAEKGAKVTIVSGGAIFAGSSFYPGTWGLGLVAPEDDGDGDNLAAAICRLGENMVVPELVEVFAKNIQRYIDKLESMGCRLKRPVDSGQREYIPCFDSKNRNWYGIMKQQSVGVLARRMTELGIVQLPSTEVVDLLRDNGRIWGAAAVCSDGIVRQISCGATVLAGGGMSGIFRYRLGTGDVNGVCQMLALEAGASLINTEFFQMFPGFIDPAPKTIYNEKMFRYTNFCYPNTGKSIFGGISPEQLNKLLEERSSHGPFTSRLADRELDRIISEQPEGVEISYKEEIKQMSPCPEFIDTYFRWLEEEKKLTMEDRVRIGIFAHASNGGILIDTTGSTGVTGLFACGEATGGMHGADRIGGLSTANCLVFGNRAGVAAADAAGAVQDRYAVDEWQGIAIIPEADRRLTQLREVNSQTLMVARCQSGIENSSHGLRLMREQAAEMSCPYSERLHTQKELRDSLHLAAAMRLTDCTQQAALLRRESRGSHYRTDYPAKDNEMERCILCTGKENTTAGFMK